jgi:ribonuclease Z
MKLFIKKYKIVIIISVVILTLLAFGLNWFRYNLPDSIVEYLFERTTTANNNVDLFIEDALYVITTGTGAPMPDINRAGPQTIVVAGDKKFAFDTGPGSTRVIESSNIGVSDLEAVFFTHYHSDHIGDLGELFLKRWGTKGVDTPLPVYGPTGVSKVVNGFESAYLLDRDYRIEHHGEEDFPESGFGGEPIEFDLGSELASSEVIYSEGYVEVIAFNVDHQPISPAVGYRVNYKDRSVVISGDLVYTESLIEHAKDVDLLVSEALNHKFTSILSESTEGFDSNASIVANDIKDYHITPKDVGIWATKSNADHVLITHILPPVPMKELENPFLRDLRAEFKGPSRMANDGTMVIMPVDSEDINYKELIK